MSDQHDPSHADETSRPAGPPAEVQQTADFPDISGPTRNQPPEIPHTSGSEPSGSAAANRRRLAEAKLLDTPTIFPLDPAPLSRPSLDHELQVHQLELELQNEELQRTVEELEDSRQRYFDLYDLAPVGYLTIGPAAQILEANLTAATLLGTDRRWLVTKPLTSFIHKEDRDHFYLNRRQNGSSAEANRCELRMVKG
ncbi:MAG: PAS domain-containing protein, partial [Verrucomicrobiota bacterium]